MKYLKFGGVTVLAVQLFCISHMLCQNAFIFGKICYFLYVLDIYVSRNGNN